MHFSQIRTKTVTITTACTLALVLTPNANADDCATGCTQAAMGAQSFTDSVGVNTHLGYDDYAYSTSFPMIRDRLAELGVKHIRDSTYKDGTRLTDVVPRMKELEGLGIKGDLVSGDPQLRYGAGTIDQHLAWVKANVSSFVESLEGPNEYNGHYGSDPNWQQTLRDYQCEWARKIRADPVLSSKTVVGPAPYYTGFGTLGDLTACLDIGNFHPYPGAWSPNRTNQGDLSVSLAAAQKTSGSKPIWFTESGYHNAVNCVCGHDPVSEKASGVYIPRMFMENLRRGVPRTYAYELIDGLPDSPRTDPERNFGLLRNNGTPKPAFTTVRNMLSILSDTKTASGNLSYSLKCTANCSTPLRHVLMRKSTGDYYLAVWPESLIWNTQNRTDVTAAAQSFELNVFSPTSRLATLDPAQSTTPISTTATSVYNGALSDKMLIFQITPSATPEPTPVPNPNPTPTPSPSETFTHFEQHRAGELISCPQSGNDIQWQRRAASTVLWQTLARNPRHRVSNRDVGMALRCIKAGQPVTQKTVYARSKDIKTYKVSVLPSKRVRAHITTVSTAKSMSVSVYAITKQSRRKQTVTSKKTGRDLTVYLRALSPGNYVVRTVCKIKGKSRYALLPVTIK